MSRSAQTTQLDEFIEIQNITGTTVKLYDPANPTNVWKLRDAVSFSFPTGSTLAPTAYALVVSFDPATNAAQLAAFRAKYSVANSVAIFGPWTGKLANSTDSVELVKPIAPVAGVAPYVMMDKVAFTTVAPWPITTATVGPDGKGQSPPADQSPNLRQRCRQLGSSAAPGWSG